MDSSLDRRWIVANVTGSMYDDELNSTYAFVVGRFEINIDDDGDVRIDELCERTTDLRMFIPKDSLNFLLIMNDRDVDNLDLDFKYGEDGYNLL